MKTKSSRRLFLLGLSVLSIFPRLVNATPRAELKTSIKKKAKEIFVNGHHDEVGSFFISSLDEFGNEKNKFKLPEMPHGFAIDPYNKNRLVTFPGLTGVKSIIVDLGSGKEIAQINIRSGRSFNGHGAFSIDGKLLFATENVNATSEGIIGVYDAQTYEFIKEIPAYGLGPHGMRVMPDGKTIVVASGGLRTRPKTGKYYFDMNKMVSSVNFIDIETGKLIAKRTIPVHRLSIRNVYPDQNNNLIVTCQYYGKRDVPGVVGIIHEMGEIEMLDIDEDNLWLMNGYTGGSVIVGNTAVISCPRGNQLTFWDIKNKRFIKAVEIVDVSGVQPYEDGKSLIATAETGKLYKVEMDSSKVTLLGDSNNRWKTAKWTNHMIKTWV